MLVLVSHPFLDRSALHMELVSAAHTLPNIEVRHIDSARRPDGTFDAAIEQAVIEKHQTIVLQYPLYWYATPPALKQYLDDVLTSDWTYPDGTALAGRTLAVATTMGAGKDTYSREGENYFTLDEVLIPLRMTAQACGMQWQAPWTIFGTPDLTAADRREAADSYAKWLSSLD